MRDPASAARILLADDEDTFAEATAALLRRDGYEVDVAADGHRARALVGANDYDLLISDLQMPGNDDLALVREVARTSGGLPVIIVTGVPTVASAIASISLPVSAYLLKPLEFDALRAAVLAAVSRFRSWRMMRAVEERLAAFHAEFGRLAAGRQTHGGSAIGVDAFLALTLRNVMGSLEDLEQLGRALSGGRADGNACHAMNCPRGLQLEAAVHDAIKALEETKSAFKSKTLAHLRQKLEQTLNVT